MRSWVEYDNLQSTWRLLQTIITRSTHSDTRSLSATWCGKGWTVITDKESALMMVYEQPDGLAQNDHDNRPLQCSCWLLPQSLHLETPFSGDICTKMTATTVLRFTVQLLAHDGGSTMQAARQKRHHVKNGKRKVHGHHPVKLHCVVLGILC